LSFRTPSQRWFADILDAIAMINQFTSAMDFDAFRANPMAVAAVERKRQIISEAAIRLTEEAERLSPDIPWRDIRGIGNQLRHSYERIDLATIWSTVVYDLPTLKVAVEDALKPRNQE
jgi:uncharacterized protein with HEPN domain